MRCYRFIRKISYLATLLGLLLASPRCSSAEVSKIICPGGSDLYTSGGTEVSPATQCATAKKAFSRLNSNFANAAKTTTSGTGDSTGEKTGGYTAEGEALKSVDGKVTTSVERRDFARQRRSRGGVARVPYCEFAGLARGAERQRVIFQILDDDLPISLKQVEIRPNRAATPWRVIARGYCRERRLRLAPFRS